MKKILLILFLLITVIRLEVFANTDKPPLIFVFHINGINTTFREAQANTTALKNAVEVDTNMAAWDMLYNPTSGSLGKDIEDVLKIKAQEQKSLDIDDYVETYMKTYNLHYDRHSIEYAKLKDDIKDLYIKDPSFSGKNLENIVDQFHKKVPMEFEAIVNILRNYKNTSASVILVPHSQGNQYANQLWNYVINAEYFPKERLQIFGIAAPTDKIEGFGRYTTAMKDRVINSLTTFTYFSPRTNPPLPSNFEDISCQDTLCHNLIETYLYDKTSRKNISKHISTLMYSAYTYILKQEGGKTINFIYKPESYKKIKIINSQGETICDELACDENLMMYLDTPLYSAQAKYANLNPGTYYMLSKDLTIPDILQNIQGSLNSALVYTYTTNANDKCHRSEQETIYTPGFQEKYLSSRFSCREFPENSVINGNLIISKFILTPPKIH